jgi:sugar lactone lactonase YvrE
MMRPPVSSLLVGTLSLAACAPAAGGAADLHTWDPASAAAFPADRSLLRPEDGVVLPDGRLLVADRRHGLVAMAPDGSSRPFGRFGAAGYVHEPPGRSAGPNGVSLTPDGANLLVADVLTGAIYQVNVTDETTVRIYQHEFGVNTAVRDRTGAIWFTQSTENAGPESESRMFAAVDRGTPDGALYRIAPQSGDRPLPAAEQKASGLDFANGVVIDEAKNALYVAETVGNRIVGFRISPETGELSDRRVVANVLTPDNIEIDESGRLWVASAIGNELLVVDPASGAVRSVFRSRTAASDSVVTEWRRRSAAGEPRLPLFSPAMWAPLPGLVTGVILTPGGGPVYVTGLGDAVTKLEAQR